MSKSLEDVELVGGHPAVDFVNTVHNWTSEEAPDYLHGFADFLGWNERVGLLWPRAVAHFLGRPAAEQADAMREVRSLRESLHAIYAARAAGSRLPQKALDHLNEAVRRTVNWRCLAADTDNDCRTLCCLWDFRQAPAIAALGPVAWKAAEFLELGATDRLKACPADDCGWLFVDTSKNRSRTWCSMKTCGNAAKVRRFRERHQ
ncbi:MAG: CGNR zinc finger domain-containing protein [Gammaproteobacteria bacterium]|jgi:predicted RNA-binding Zn ribbon-like protein